jgi:hypothetical protein
MSAVYLEQITPVWNDFSKFIHVLQSEQDYAQAVALLDSLMSRSQALAWECLPSSSA